MQRGNDMAGDRVICNKNDVGYVAIRMAMIGGARTVAELQAKANVCGECDGCRDSLEAILASVCSCKTVSLQSVVDAVKAGAGTVEKVGEMTQAGTGCGRCQPLIANVIELGR